MKIYTKIIKHGISNIRQLRMSPSRYAVITGSEVGAR